MTTYIYNIKDKGIFGDTLEKAIKKALNRSNPDFVSPQGQEDFRFNRKHYEIKQNGSCIRYHGNKQYIKGSSRVIYATHIACTVATYDETKAVSIDLQNTDLFCVDKQEFLDFLLNNGMTKENGERGETNIQSLYNYSRSQYIGKKGKVIEKWCTEHSIDTEIIDLIKANCED